MEKQPGRPTLPFRDREEAAEHLARALARHRGRNPLVLAIPRGAVPMGGALAEALDGQLDVVLVHKLGAPFSPELAIGAIDETGEVIRTPETSMYADEEYLRREARAQLVTLAQRRKRYNRPPVDPRDRVVIVVDDGLATGSTMVAALQSVRARRPARLIAAVPVASTEALQRIEPLADEVVCLHTDPGFQAVGFYYRDFRQVDDDEVEAELRRRAKARPVSQG